MTLLMLLLVPVFPHEEWPWESLLIPSSVATMSLLPKPFESQKKYYWGTGDGGGTAVMDESELNST